MFSESALVALFCRRTHSRTHVGVIPWSYADGKLQANYFGLILHLYPAAQPKGPRDAPRIVLEISDTRTVVRIEEPTGGLLNEEEAELRGTLKLLVEQALLSCGHFDVASLPPAQPREREALFRNIMTAESGEEEGIAGADENL